jgi:predicted RNase H-like HicB family nuclease
MANKIVYPAVFYQNENGGYTVEVPDLPGCTTEGESMADAIRMAEDAASGWILGELEDKRPVPPPSTRSGVKLDESIAPDGFVQFIVLDIAEYSKRYGKQTVKKNLTIPAWLESIAADNNLNFSQVLQDALIEKLNITQ